MMVWVNWINGGACGAILIARKVCDAIDDRLLLAC